jgi:hypothetical protein
LAAWLKTRMRPWRAMITTPLWVARPRPKPKGAIGSTHVMAVLSKARRSCWCRQRVVGIKAGPYEKKRVDCEHVRNICHARQLRYLTARFFREWESGNPCWLLQNGLPPVLPRSPSSAPTSQPPGRSSRRA